MSREEPRKSFHHALEAVRADIVQLAAYATESIPRATLALLNGDLDAAQQVIDHDDVLDAKSMSIEEQCLRLLALQQPMATDLREVMTALRLNSELERTGDLCVNICKVVRRIYGSVIDPRVRGLIEAMNVEAHTLTRRAVDAYATHDAGLAAALDDMDDTLDALQAEYVQAIIHAHDTSAMPLHTAVQLALVGRYYERIGDHAVNIGERTQYLISGWLPEHTGAARARARLQAAEAVDEPPPVDVRLLVTNDDGVFAPGLLHLATAMRAAGHEVRIVAPAGQMSGCGASIATPGDRIDYEPVDLTGWPDEAIAIDGSPGLCVVAGVLGVFGPAPDAVVSGVNPGYNTGRSTLHSGTVGAALTAAAWGVPGVAVSIDVAAAQCWETATELAARTVDTIDPAARPVAINLNVPNVALAELRGVRDATVAPLGAMRSRVAEHRPGSVRLTLVRNATPVPEGTDTALVHEGYATVSVLSGPAAVASRALAASIEAAR